MKIKTLVFVLLSVISVTALGQNKKIALLEPRVGDGSTGVSGMEKAMVRGELRKAIVNHAGYEAFTRADIDKLMAEQDFQRTGMVSDDQIKEIGIMSGADYICISTLNKTNTEFYLEAYLVNVETAQISNPASQYGELTNGKLGNMLPVCQALAQELLGAISPVVSYNTASSQPMPATGGQNSSQVASNPMALEANADTSITMPDGTILWIARSPSVTYLNPAIFGDTQETAFEGCACMGNNWRLPSRQELQFIHKIATRNWIESNKWLMRLNICFSCSRGYWTSENGVWLKNGKGVIQTDQKAKSKGLYFCVKEQ